VDDIARGRLAGPRPLGYLVINLGSDKPVMLRDAIGLVERLVGKETRLGFESRHRADMLATWANIGKGRGAAGLAA
jgi:UDP-glucuronate 4-epimerase